MIDRMAEASPNLPLPGGELRSVLALLVKFLFVGVLGVVLGLVVTFLTIEQGSGFNAVAAGPWLAFPRNGTFNIDPYARAMLAHSGEMPLGASEGLAFVARSDSAGDAFDPDCDYTLTGAAPPGRYWTLTLLSPSGFLITNKALRHGFTSSEILRAADGGFTVAISREARPGNWLPIGDARKFILVLRLYDTEVSAVAVALDESKLPKLIRGACQ
ncbi:DUF1214 domain-containing protein [Methylocapsa polymorpha]|uniref:DUF1214 domain-containing protein n=1 Tax=Methylocapsa polymorpha TaxID=3080828 RepID=A0ABZ0HV58_9HYPH|nr:DUF1214 domain-containing protein [Methylocapsa sp. RX1]